MMEKTKKHQRRGVNGLFYFSELLQAIVGGDIVTSAFASVGECAICNHVVIVSLIDSELSRYRSIKIKVGLAFIYIMLVYLA